MPKPKEKPICRECGSDDVLADAYASWDVESQTWELTTTFDKGSVCGPCGGECRLEWILISTISDDDLDGESGQDRESYSDDQDRESYEPEDQSQGDVLGLDDEREQP